MKYKISDTPLKLREYGRNIQSMVEFAKKIEDKKKRSRVVKEIVRIMASLNPKIKEMPDYEQKLWDHLYLVADFDLDVDAPFPVPDPKELVAPKHPKMSYPNNPPVYKQYGKNTELMIEKALEFPEGSPQRRQYVNYVASTMKLFLRVQNRESTPEEAIAQHMEEISKGRLKVDPKELVISKNQIKGSGLPFENGRQFQIRTNTKKGRGRKKNNQGNNRNNRRRK